MSRDLFWRAAAFTVRRKSWASMLFLRLRWKGGQPAPLQNSSSLWAAYSVFSLLSPEETFTSDPPRRGPKQGFSWSWQDEGWACHAASSSDPAPEFCGFFQLQHNLKGQLCPWETALPEPHHPSCSVSFPNLPALHLLLKFRIKLWMEQEQEHQHSLPLVPGSPGCHIISSLQASSVPSCRTHLLHFEQLDSVCSGCSLAAWAVLMASLLHFSLWNPANFHQQKGWLKLMICSRQETAGSVSLGIHQSLHVNPVELCQELIKNRMSKINSQMQKWASKLTDWLWQSLPS